MELTLQNLTFPALVGRVALLSIVLEVPRRQGILAEEQ
jgi:hypothetical protein